MLLGVTKKQSASSAWEAYIASLSPDIWLKMTEVTNTQLVADGNWGTQGGSVAGSSGTGMLYGQTGVTPSEPARLSVYRNSSNNAIYISSTAATYLSTATIVCAFRYDSGGVSDASTQILWRDQTTFAGGSWFLNIVGTNISLRIRGANVTPPYASANLKDGNPHLIGITIDATSYHVYVDGVGVASAALGGSTVSRDGWAYTCNSSPFNSQAAAGWYGDFIIWGTTFTATDMSNMYSVWN